MQCPSCRFENMPGSGNCARCGALLAVGDIDVMPPRANAVARRVPLELRTGVYRLRLAGAEALARIVGILPLRSRDAAGQGGGAFAQRPTLPAGHRYPGQAVQEIDLEGGDWPALSIPGWVQLRHGERARGRWLLGVALLLLFLSVLFAGTPWSAASLGILFSWHLMATVDASCRRFASFGDRVRFTLWGALLLGALLYLPALWGIAQVARPLSIQHNTRYFQSGDVVWYRPLAEPAIGDLVLYDVPTNVLSGRRGNQAANVRIEGQRINRLVAVAGQRLSWQQNRLMVDGQPSRWQPQFVDAAADFVVPQNHVYILPEDLVPQQFQTGANAGMELGVVPAHSVEGVVFWRTYPLGRMEPL